MENCYHIGRVPYHEEPDTILIGKGSCFFARVVGRPSEKAEPLATVMFDALNTHAATGRKASELAAWVERMREMLKEVRDELFQRISDRHDPKTAHHWPEIQKADALLAELGNKPNEGG